MVERRGAVESCSGFEAISIGTRPSAPRCFTGVDEAYLDAWPHPSTHPRPNTKLH